MLPRWPPGCMASSIRSRAISTTRGTGMARPVDPSAVPKPCRRKAPPPRRSGAGSDKGRPMHTTTGPRVAFLFLASAVSAAPPARTAPRQYTIEQFMAVVRLSGASFSPDEKRVLFSSNQSGIFNAYSVPVAGGGAAQLTRSTTDTTYAVSYFPKDERIFYTRDNGGDENNHLYVRGADGKERDLTPAAAGTKLKAAFLRWSGD